MTPGADVEDLVDDDLDTTDGVNIDGFAEFTVGSNICSDTDEDAFFFSLLGYDDCLPSLL